jgi:hypothetical protein
VCQGLQFPEHRPAGVDEAAALASKMFVLESQNGRKQVITGNAGDEARVELAVCASLFLWDLVQERDDDRLVVGPILAVASP